MYNLVYEQMVNAGIAVWLVEEDLYWVNKNGEEVQSNENAVRLKVKNYINNPEWLLFGGEVGTDTSQKNDGNVEG